MGECGCGATNLLAKFPGPDGVMYGLEVYPGCRYCGTPIGVVMHRFDPSAKHGEDMEEFFFGVPDMPFQGYGNPDFEWSWSEAAVMLVDPETIFNGLEQQQEEFDSEVILAFEQENLRSLMQDQVRSSLSHWVNRVTDQDPGEAP